MTETADRDAMRYRWLRKQSVGYPTFKVAISFPVMGEGGAALKMPKDGKEIDAWIDEHMRRFP